MDGILRDISRKSLINAIEGNLFDLYRYYGKSAKGDFHEEQNILWLITGIHFPLFNSIAHARFPKDRLRDRIEETIARFALRHVPVMWWIGPSTYPSNLGDILEAYKFKHEVDLTCMAIALKNLNGKQHVRAGVSTILVNDIETLRQWCQTVSLGFNIPDGMGRLLFEFEYSLGYESHLPWQRYLVTLDGEPAAASALMLGSGVAGIYWTATVPRLRLQGLGTASVLEPLRKIQDEGYRIAVLHSTPMGASMYRRIGFKQYCTVSRYIRSET